MLSPEMLGIALGLFMALGIFALKTAVGNYYFLALPGSAPVKIVSFSLIQLGYILLFLAAFPLLRNFDFARVNGSSAFLKNGMLIHLLLCGGLIYWGIRLLLRHDDGKPDRLNSKGWLLLTVPCPVCASAILLVCAFSLMVFPAFAERLRWLIPLSFLGLNGLFLGLLFGTGKFFRIRPLILVGRMMILIALYFILILLIAPQFQAAGRLYAVARASAENGIFPASWLVAVLLIAATSVAAGFLWNFFRTKRS